MFVHLYDNPAYIDPTCYSFHRVTDKTTEPMIVDARQKRLKADMIPADIPAK